VGIRLIWWAQPERRREWNAIL